MLLLIHESHRGGPASSADAPPPEDESTIQGTKDRVLKDWLDT